MRCSCNDFKAAAGCQAATWKPAKNVMFITPSTEAPTVSNYAYWVALHICSPMCLEADLTSPDLLMRLLCCCLGPTPLQGVCQAGSTATMGKLAS